jgi:transposase
MIDQGKRMAVFQLHLKGKGKREISRLLEISRNTVSTIIANEGKLPTVIRKDTTFLDEEELRKLYVACEGRIQRIHEILTERDKVTVGYSTLSRKLRELGLGKVKKPRCERVPDVPGEEMQHDTTIYFVKLGSKKVKLIASLLYFRYSKIRYLKFYRNFNRFRMKCFIHEALSYFGYAAATCIIDNTNLARLRGSGKTAIIVPEMERFSLKYRFRFICHALNHPNRKAGNERGFYTVETNFLPGRRFETLEEMNLSAFKWATDRMFHRAARKTGLIPAKAFEYEQSLLNKLPPYLEAPYRDHHRVTDQYGYAAFAGNYYWIPGKKRNNVTLLEYDRSLKIFLKRQFLVEYKLPKEIVKNQSFAPEGNPKPIHRPNNRKRPTEQEEKKLRALSLEVDLWLTKLLQEKGVSRHRLIREVYRLHLKLAPSLFTQTIQRAAAYRITDVNIIERIAELLVRQSGYVMPEVDVDQEFRSRATYLEGRCSDKVNLLDYDKLMDKNENE